MKLLRNSYEFHKNLSEFVNFHRLAPVLRIKKNPVVRSCLGTRVQQCDLPIRTLHSDHPQQSTRHQELRSAMCKVQTVEVVEQDIMSIANFAKWRGEPQCRSNYPCRGGGWQAVLACTYIHI